MKALRQKLDDAKTLNEAVEVLLKWYEGDDVVFHRNFVKRLPELAPTGGSAQLFAFEIVGQDLIMTYEDNITPPDVSINNDGELIIQL